METTPLPAFTSTTVNIPRLALDAANELDEIVQGRLDHSESAKKLANLLKHSFSNGKTSKALRVKSGTVAVFCNALENLQLGSNVKDFNEVISAALGYAKKLNATKSTQGDVTKLEEAKTFCIALAKAAAGYRESVIGAQARNRWR